MAQAASPLPLPHLPHRFSSPSAAGFYPEYHALCTAMAAATGADATPTPLGGGTYLPFPLHELSRIGDGGECELIRRAPAAGSEGEGEAGGGEAEAGGTAVTAAAVWRADAVAVLVGANPDLSFLDDAALAALEEAGRPPRESEEGVAATHEVFVDVEPYSCEARALPSCFAVGPLRGDNFVRFAIHDGHAVARRLRALRGGGLARRRAMDDADDEGATTTGTGPACVAVD